MASRSAEPSDHLDVALILCGGRGTRAYPLTRDIPKPLMPVAGRPVLEHLLGIFADQGFTNFVLATGYKGEMIEDFARSLPSSWSVRVIDTGDDAGTGTRVIRCREQLGSRFLVTYSDGLADIDLSDLLESHHDSGAPATLTTVPLPSQYGTVDTDPRGKVVRFKEKPTLPDHWINAGFMIMDSAVFAEWSGDDLERDVLPALAEQGKLYAYRHRGFWKSMDTYKDSVALSELAMNARPPWLASRSHEAGRAGSA